MFFTKKAPGSISSKPVTTYAVYRLAILLCCICTGLTATAQKIDTANATHIINTKLATYTKTDSGEFYSFAGDVIMQQGTDTLYCDSLHENLTTKVFEAFSNVRIAQTDGTQATSDYLSYQSKKKLAFMQGNVTLTDGRNHLTCEELTYNLDTKTGIYNKGGVLSNDTTRITSHAGAYNVRSKDAHFTGNVVITDPTYNIRSEDLEYNTESKVTHFHAKSVVTSDSGRSVLQTVRGSYDSKNVIAHFLGHSSIWNDGQYIEADTMHYNKVTGYGFADGHVISIDTGRHSTLYCGHMEYLRRQGVIWATIKPVLEQANGKDTLYMRADSFYSAHMVREMKKNAPAPKSVKAQNDSVIANMLTTIDSNARRPMAIDTAQTAAKEKIAISDTLKQKIVKKEDTVWVVPPVKYRMPDYKYDTVRSIAQLYKKVKRKKDKDDLSITAIPDTAAADTMAPMYFIGYHHVKIFSDSLQGKCDSVCYTRSDSTIRMIVQPIVWSRKSQITGDTILMHMDSSRIKDLYVPNNAFIVSQSGPEKAHIWDQIQGKTLTAYFANNEITLMTVFPNAESIYYSKDDNGAYIGLNQSVSTRMRIFFDNQKITNIKFEQDVHQTVTPLDKADLPNAKLSKFKWLVGERPKTKEELFQ